MSTGDAAIIAALRDDNKRLRALKAEMLAALLEIVNYHGGADSALEDEYVMERVNAIIVKVEAAS